jgi:esterase
MASVGDIFGFPVLPANATYTGPSLFIRGEWSNFVRAEDTAVIHAMFPGARIVTVPAAGHWLHADQPKAFLAELQGFLRGLRGLA